jgi:UrcA family protein
MDQQTSISGIGKFLGAIGVTAVLLTGTAAAGEKLITVSLAVSADGLDLTNAADAHALYRRLTNAARRVCSHSYKVGLEPVADPQRCIEDSLADAIRTLKRPLVTQFYLENHTIAAAAARGIAASEQVAATSTKPGHQPDSP